MTIKQHGGIFGRNPSFNEVSVETLSIAGTAISSTAAELNILDGVTADAAELNYLDGASTSAVVASKAVLADSSGNIAFPNGKGIDFSATGDGSGTTSSELFDDYEEGTWTPAWSFATSGSVTLGTATGTYTKIGNIVYAYCFVSSTAISSPSGEAKITGLPFSATDSAGVSFALVRRFSTSFGADLRGQITGTEVSFYTQATDQLNAAFLEGSDFSSGGNYNQLRFSIVYKV